MGDPSQLDRLEVLPVPKGSGIEPEEAPAKRTQALPLTVNLAPTLPDVTEHQGRPALDFPGAIPVARKLAPVTSELPAGEVAKLLSERCAQCIHFRNDDWQRTQKTWGSAPPGSERRLGLTKMQIQLARSVLDRPPDLSDLRRANADLRFWGVCDALTEARSDLVIVHPEACCPEGFHAFKNRDADARRTSSDVYDKIMRAAQGKI
jgi:hypothetical protein